MGRKGEKLTDKFWTTDALLMLRTSQQFWREEDTIGYWVTYRDNSLVGVRVDVQPFIVDPNS